jgi:predicted RNA methylase
MFTQDFFPTPLPVVEQMLQHESLAGKTILEPSAGKGNIVDYLLNHQAGNIIAAEINEDLRSILAAKCTLIAKDFLLVESHHVSHIDLIVMNPPFSADDKHILHAFHIAPPGCKIIALCNRATIKNDYSKTRQELVAHIENFGTVEDLGQCFSTAERKTDVAVALIRLLKPGAGYNTEFDGFFMEDEHEDQANAIMPYNFIRDLVNRYVGAIKIYDQQLEAAVKMNNLTDGFYGSAIAMTITEEGKPKARNEYKKDLQKAAWNYIFHKLNMQKYATRGLKEDINKFVEQQGHIIPCSK